MSDNPSSLHANLDGLDAQQLKRLLIEHLTRQKLGLYWESNAIDRDRALNADIVLPRLAPELSCRVDETATGPYQNLIIEGDNFDSLRLLKATHAHRIRVIYLDPPYNTGNKDWVYNDRYIGKNDRWRHSLWLEFLYRRLVLARDLLTPDGVILVSINDENRARLELLMDEVFPGRRVGSLAWRTKDTGNDAGQRFSHVHEHVLIYANAGFRFNGRATNRNKFRNPDNDPRGDWAPRPLTKAHTLSERDNTYYPIQDPKTKYWYPCDPDSVWRFASESKMPEGQKLRSETMEELIRQDLIYFPPSEPDKVMQFETRAALDKALREGKGPVLPKKKTPLLRDELPDLDFWVGKPIAPGRPSRKDHWTSKPESERIAPLGSWIAGVNEDVEIDAEDEDNSPELLRSTRGGVATDEVKEILGSRAFQFPKPITLIRNLLRQASGSEDIVLDFFAGSGTTGQAVLELNMEDDGARRFILCSSTEATEQEPQKNICRDVCAERMRRLIQGYGKRQALTGDFAYLRIDKIEPADIYFETDPNHAFQLLSLRETHCAEPVPSGSVMLVATGEDLSVALCTEVTPQSIDALATLPGSRIAVYSHRPETVQDLLELRGKSVNSYSLTEALLRGQGGKI